jgi:hypothetical protein
LVHGTSTVSVCRDPVAWGAWRTNRQLSFSRKGGCAPVIARPGRPASLIVALALLDKTLPNAVYYFVACISLADLILAYRVEMDLALIDAGYL